MSATILQGNVFDLLPTIEPGSIDCAVTSPPYWMLRSYLPKGHALKPLELGSEPTPAAFVANMVKVFRLVRECLADHGTCWLNIGDSYAGSGKSGGGSRGKKWNTMGAQPVGPKGGFGWRTPGVVEGNLCLIPQRLAIALQDDGWIVRSVIVWHKPAAMPASLSGWQWRRCRVKVGPSEQRHQVNGIVGNYNIPGAHASASTPKTSAEWSDCPGCAKCKPNDGLVLRRGSWRPTSSWEPIIMLAKSARYFADGEAVKQPAASATISRNEYTRITGLTSWATGEGSHDPADWQTSERRGSKCDADEQFAAKHDHEYLTTTANLRDVWTIAAEPLREKHYAAFPTELVHRCLKAGTSARGYCPACGGPWVRIISSSKGDVEADRRPKQTAGMSSGTSTLSLGGNGSREWAERGTSTETTGWRPSCRCPAHEPRPGRVLDPFAGSGRTLIESLRLGLDGIGCELNPEYVAMARRLLTNESPLFAGAIQ